jgi:hypothetical protein
MVKCFQHIVTQAINCYNSGVHVFLLASCGLVTNNFTRRYMDFSVILPKVATVLKIG